MTTNIAGSSVIHPVVIVDVNGRKLHALLDSGASQSYVLSTLIDLIEARVVRSGTRRVATLLGITTKLKEYDLCLRAVKGDFALNMRVFRIDKRELLMLDNPRYAERIANHSHLIELSWKISHWTDVYRFTSSWEQMNTRRSAHAHSRVLDAVENLWLNLLVLAGHLWHQE